MDKKNIADKIGFLSTLQKVLLLLLTAGVIYGSYWYFILDDKLTAIAKIQGNIAKLDKDIADFRIQVAKLPELEQQLDSRKKELYYAKTLLPEDAQALENLLSSFEKLGREGDVQFLLFQPGAEQQQEFYATRPVQLQLSGTFHHLVTYFDHLARLDRLVTIQDVKFTPVSDFSPTEKYLNTTVMLQVYRALTDAEIQAKKAQNQKK